MNLYKNILIYGITCFILSNVLFIIAFMFSTKKENYEKITAYECGFNSFDNSKTNHDIHFFITAVSFLILDLETMYLFPWAKNLWALNLQGFWVIIGFLCLLLVGFLIEIKIGSLKWELTL